MPHPPPRRDGALQNLAKIDRTIVRVKKYGTILFNSTGNGVYHNGHTSNGNGSVQYDSGEEEGEGEEGELMFWSRAIMMGYLNQPEKTLEATDNEETREWFLTGDLVRMDADGFVFITGRAKEIIITSGGENIAPVPIEERIKVAI